MLIGLFRNLAILTNCIFSVQILEGLLRLPENRECADCKSKWVELCQFSCFKHGNGELDISRCCQNSFLTLSVITWGNGSFCFLNVFWVNGTIFYGSKHLQIYCLFRNLCTCASTPLITGKRTKMKILYQQKRILDCFIFHVVACPMGRYLFLKLCPCWKS